MKIVGNTVILIFNHFLVSSMFSKGFFLSVVLEIVNSFPNHEILDLSKYTQIAKQASHKR